MNIRAESMAPVGRHSGTIAKSQEATDAVLSSCFLDLLYDEEKPGDLGTWAKKHGWTKQLRKAQKCVKTARNNGAFARSKTPATKDQWAAFERFLQLKAKRVWALLEYEAACAKHTKSSISHHNRRQAGLKRHCEESRRTLENILYESLATFGQLKMDPEVNGVDMQTLSALYYSEVCACGTTADVSYGMARAFETLFLADRNWPWRWLFRLVAKHNQARGWNHQRNHVECIRLLVPTLERFSSNVPEEKYYPLAERLVYFPAILTLADSLKDCHRAAEAAWWLRLARYDDEHQPSAYWRARLDLELWGLGAESEPILSAGLNEKPRLLNIRERCTILDVERRLADGGDDLDLAQEAKRWADAVISTIRWHEGDSVPLLLGVIKGAAQSSVAVCKDMRRRCNNAKDTKQERYPRKYNECLGQAVRVLDHIRRTIKQASIDKTLRTRAFGFLAESGQTPDEALKSPNDALRAWIVLKFLMPSIRDVLAFRSELIRRGKKTVLATWLKTLEKRLQEALDSESLDRGVFRDVASYQEVYNILGNPQQLCPPDPTDIRKHSRSCKHKPNCSEKILRLGDSSQPPDAVVATTSYLLSNISRTEAEFGRFLKEKSMERRHDETAPVTPRVELVCLRRWNSFSPNLASRATATVGGGYLVRIWCAKTKRYVGIGIDPGYNFLENLFDEGFKLPDLDVIVITHAHPDHVENLSNILTLLRERVTRTKRTSRILLVMTEGVYRRFKDLIDNEIEFVRYVVVLSWASPGRDCVHLEGSDQDAVSLWMEKTTTPLASIQAVKAIHADGTEFDSMGVVVTVPGVKDHREDHRNVSIGITSDTRYTPELCESAKFSACDVVVPHLGSLLKDSAFRGLHEKPDLLEHDECCQRAVEQIQATLTEKNHLYLPGIAMFLCDLRHESGCSKPLVVLSEFGEELRGGLRVDIATRLQRTFEMSVVPADVGLRIGVEDRTIRCVVCLRYVSADRVRSVAVSDHDEALMAVCNDCRHAREHELLGLLARLRTSPRLPDSTREPLKREPAGGKKKSQKAPK
jgi:hypothetical protein